MERKTERIKQQGKTMRKTSAINIAPGSTVSAAAGTPHIVPTRVPKIDGYEIVTYMDKHGAQSEALMYDFVEINAATLGIGLFHVNGADATSYLALAGAKGFVHSAVTRSPIPVKVLGGLNKFLYDTWEGRIQINATFCVLDLERNSMACCSCGQMPMVFYSHSREKAFYVRPKYPALGAIDSIKYRDTVKDFKFVVDKNDWVVMLNPLPPSDPGGAQMIVLLQKLLTATPEISCTQFLNLMLSARKSQTPHPLALVGLVQRTKESLVRTFQSPGRLLKCKFCDHVNESYTDVCTVCGSPLAHITARLEQRKDEIMCPSCKTPVRMGSRGCPRCQVLFCTLCLERLPEKDQKICKPCSDMHGGFFDSSEGQ